MVKRRKVVWLFGLSGAGKTTLSNLLKHYFDGMHISAIQLDGDCLRSGLNSDLGFAPNDRSENVRRTAELAKLFLSVNVTPIVSLITPYEKDRLMLKEIIGPDHISLIFIDCTLDVCEKRDVKGLYAKARNNIIQSFTAIHDPFELPQHDHIRIDTTVYAIEEAFEKLRTIVNFE